MMLLVILTGLLGVIATIKSCRHWSRWEGVQGLHPWPEKFLTYKEGIESARHELLGVVYFVVSMVAFLACGSFAIYS